MSNLLVKVFFSNSNFFRKMLFELENNQLEIHLYWFCSRSIIWSYFHRLQKGLRFHYPEKTVTDSWVNQQVNLDCVFKEWNNSLITMHGRCSQLHLLNEVKLVCCNSSMYPYLESCTNQRASNHHFLHSVQYLKSAVSSC